MKLWSRRTPQNPGRLGTDRAEMEHSQRSMVSGHLGFSEPTLIRMMKESPSGSSEVNVSNAHLVGGLVAINFIFPEILGCCHHPN